MREMRLAPIKVSIATAYFSRKIQIEHGCLVPKLFSSLRYGIKIKVSSLKICRRLHQAHYLS